MSTRQKPKRRRIPKTISLNGIDELRVLDSAIGRAQVVLLDANASETFRLGIHLINIVSPELLKQASGLLERREPGRPTRRSLYHNIEVEFSDPWEEEEKQRMRLTWLEEL